MWCVAAAREWWRCRRETRTERGDSVFSPSQACGKTRGVREVTLIRHGRPELSRNVLLTARDYEAWWKRYDASGLRSGQVVPERIRTLVAHADVVVSSPLPRAHASAVMAREAEPDHTLAELVEAPLPPPGLGPLKFRPLTWGTISRILWLSGRSAGQESAREAGARAAKAAEALEGLTQTHPSVCVFAHGWFNRMVGRQLRRRGWRCEEGRGDGYWSFRRYVKD